MNGITNSEHPDQHEIDDWFLYGPKDQKIEVLVRELTLLNGLRLADVERTMIDALETKLRSVRD